MYKRESINIEGRGQFDVSIELYIIEVGLPIASDRQPALGLGANRRGLRVDGRFTRHSSLFFPRHSTLVPVTLSSARKPAISKDAHRDTNRALANRRSHQRANPLAATGYCRDRQAAVAHGTGSGSESSVGGHHWDQA
jgi:hypothetical protein